MSETRESERRGGHYELLWMEQSHDSERMAIQFIDNVQGVELDIIFMYIKYDIRITTL